MPYLKAILVNATDKSNRMLRAKSMECISLVGMAVGKDKFREDAKQVGTIMCGSVSDWPHSMMMIFSKWEDVIIFSFLLRIGTTIFFSFRLIFGSFLLLQGYGSPYVFARISNGDGWPNNKLHVTSMLLSLTKIWREFDKLSLSSLSFQDYLIRVALQFLGLGQALQVFGARFSSLYDSCYATSASICTAQARCNHYICWFR